MGYRALVAYRRPDRRYDLRYSHWGGEDVTLADRISAETPLGDGDVDGDLLAEAIDRDRLLIEYLDPCHYEALYVVEPGGDYRVTAYRVCWLEWPDGRDGGRGAIVAVENDAADRRVRTWLRATKTTLADVVEMGVLSWRAARTYLEARVCEDEDGAVYTYGASDADSVDYAPSSTEWLDGDGRRDSAPRDERWGPDGGQERNEGWNPDEDGEGRGR